MKDKKERFEPIEIYETVAILFTNDDKELFDAILANTKKGIITGRIIHVSSNEYKKLSFKDKSLLEKYDSQVFIEKGFIPLINIKDIQSCEKKIILRERNNI